MAAESKIALFTRLGHWYSEKVARPDLGVPCFQAVLSVDPAHAGALEGLANVYRRAQQWQELGQVLVTRADRAPTPAAARDLRAEAADLLETRLNESAHARDLYETIFAEDPGHQKATDALARIYARLEDWAGLAKILERRAEALRGRGQGRGHVQAGRALRGPAQQPPRGHPPLRGGARARPAEPHRAQGPRPHLQPHRQLQGSPRQPGEAARALGHAAPEDQAPRAHRRHPGRGVLEPREGRRGLRADPPRRRRPRGRALGAGAPLPRPRPLGGRGPALREEPAHRRRRQAQGRALPGHGPRARRPGRLPGARPQGLREGAGDRPQPRRRAGVARPRARRHRRRHGRAQRHRVARREVAHARGQGRPLDPRREDAGGRRATATAPSSATRRRSTPARATSRPSRRAARRLPRPRRRHQRRRAHHARDRDRRRQPGQGPPLRRDGPAPAREAQGLGARPRRGDQGRRPRPHQHARPPRLRRRRLRRGPLPRGRQELRVARQPRRRPAQGAGRQPPRPLRRRARPRAAAWRRRSAR